MRRQVILLLGLSAGVCLVVAGLGESPVAKAQDKKPREIKDFGEVTDPDGDCKIEEKEGKLTIKVPGSLHDLFPNQKDEKKRLNAPRVLREVEGDFVAYVKVTADWKPGGKIAEANTFPYNGAGLLIWGEGGEFVRLERNVWIAGAMPTSYITPLYYRGGRLVGGAKSTREEFYKDRTTWLRVEREGAKVTTSISHDGKEWSATGELETEFPKKIRVGVHAINSSDGEFVVEFEDFQVKN
jgi:regulation of enolase protein 1 (concanavalin A-like superfamily)